MKNQSHGGKWSSRVHITRSYQSQNQPLLHHHSFPFSPVSNFSAKSVPLMKICLFLTWESSSDLPRKIWEDDYGIFFRRVSLVSCLRSLYRCRLSRQSWYWEVRKQIVCPVHRMTIRVWLLTSVFWGGCISQIQIDLEIQIEHVSVKGVGAMCVPSFDVSCFEKKKIYLLNSIYCSQLSGLWIMLWNYSWH